MNKRLLISSIIGSIILLSSICYLSIRPNQFTQSYQTEEIPFNIVATTVRSNLKTNYDLVITNQGFWQEFWKISFGNQETPYVNFSSTSLIAVSSGKKPSTGYSISITNLTLRINTLIIKVEEVVPDKDCGAGLIHTFPIQIIKFSKITNIQYLSYEFSRSIRIRNCK